MTDSVPTERLVVTDPNKALDEILAFGAQLEAKGQRPWFEVWYPRPDWFEGSDIEWSAHQAASFDAVEVVAGDINTLLPYDMLEAS